VNGRHSGAPALPERLDELETAAGIGRMQAAEPVAGMQVEAHAEAEADQRVDRGVELRELARHAVAAAEHGQQTFRRHRQPDMAEAARAQARQHRLVRPPGRLAAHPAGEIEAARQEREPLGRHAGGGALRARAMLGGARRSGESKRDRRGRQKGTACAKRRQHKICSGQPRSPRQRAGR
jgi:hypothetical protein